MFNLLATKRQLLLVNSKPNMHTLGFLGSYDRTLPYTAKLLRGETFAVFAIMLPTANVFPSNILCVKNLKTIPFCILQVFIARAAVLQAHTFDVL